MLVLTRQRDEVVEIVNPLGQVIAEVAVVDIRGDKVRLGVVAAGLGIHRREVREAIQAEGGNPGVQGERKRRWMRHGNRGAAA